MKKAILETESPSPLYVQLMRKLRAEIASGVYPLGTRIPSEQELCERYGVSRVTVRKALGELTGEGLLERHQGKGTFVRVPKIRRDLRSVNSFADTCRMTGHVASTQVVRIGTADADEMDAEAGLGRGQVVEIVRLRLADGEPVNLETNHFAPSMAWLTECDLTGSLYSLLRTRGIEPGEATHEISLARADADAARLLRMEPGSALLRLDEVIFDQDGHPLHTSRQKIRGDRFTFRI